jgi:predicted nucleic acid-binding protein
VIVVDTSAWVELLRGTGSPVHRTLTRLIVEGAELAVTEVVVAEVLAGAAGPAPAVDALRARLLAFPVLTLDGLEGFEEAAALLRHGRAQGVTVRKLADCLIAVPALREGAAILHRDRDFDQLSRICELEVVTPDR